MVLRSLQMLLQSEFSVNSMGPLWSWSCFKAGVCVVLPFLTSLREGLVL